jgi:hypothetical protein
MTEQLLPLVSDTWSQFDDLWQKVALDTRFAHQVGVHTSASSRAWKRAAKSCRALELYCKQRLEESA